MTRARRTRGRRAGVTFVELGSDKCIPCREMRPVMDAVQATFGEQVEIVFHDVREDSTPAEEYGIQMIPTRSFWTRAAKTRIARWVRRACGTLAFLAGVYLLLSEEREPAALPPPPLPLSSPATTL